MTGSNLRALRAWQRAEGGSAAFNPLNTTQPFAGARDYNPIGVKHYPSRRAGLEATVDTLLNGRYAPVVRDLRSGAPARRTLRDVGRSPWGTNSDLLMQVLGGGGGGGGGGGRVGGAGGSAVRPVPAGPPDMTEFAMGLLSRVRGEEEAPDVRDLVGLAQTAQAEQAAAAAGAVGGGPRGGAGGGAGGALTPGKAWGGSRGIAKDIVAGLGLARSGKRATKMTSSGNISDHYVGNKDSFAYDNSGSVAQMDRAAAKIARRLGISYRKGHPLEITVNRHGYRIQILYRTMTGGNHFDHIHVGVDRLSTPG